MNEFFENKEISYLDASDYINIIKFKTDAKKDLEYHPLFTFPLSFSRELVKCETIGISAYTVDLSLFASYPNDSERCLEHRVTLENIGKWKKHWWFSDLGDCEYARNGRKYPMRYLFKGFFTKYLFPFLGKDEDFRYRFLECPLCNKECFLYQSSEFCGKCEQKRDELFKVKNKTEATGYLYYAKDTDNIGKIGYSLFFPSKRVKSLSVNYHKEFKLCGYSYVEDIFEAEKQIHIEFKTYRLKGEWFQISYEQMKLITKFKFIDIK